MENNIHIQNIKWARVSVWAENCKELALNLENCKIGAKSKTKGKVTLCAKYSVGQS